MTTSDAGFHWGQKGRFELTFERAGGCVDPLGGGSFGIMSRLPRWVVFRWQLFPDKFFTLPCLLSASSCKSEFCASKCTHSPRSILAEVMVCWSIVGAIFCHGKSEASRPLLSDCLCRAAQCGVVWYAHQMHVAHTGTGCYEVSTVHTAGLRHKATGSREERGPLECTGQCTCGPKALTEPLDFGSKGPWDRGWGAAAAPEQRPPPPPPSHTPAFPAPRSGLGLRLFSAAGVSTRLNCGPFV